MPYAMDYLLPLGPLFFTLVCAFALPWLLRKVKALFQPREVYSQGGLSYSQLPPELLALIFEQLPLIQRVQCRLVCVSWQKKLDEGALWRKLVLVGPRDELFKGAGMHNPAYLQNAVAQAKGQLTVLHVNRCPEINFATVAAAAAANAASLSE
jgi:hypothetical protein